MLLRCLLATKRAALRERVLPFLRRSTVHVRGSVGAEDLWTQSRHGGLDLIVVERQLLGDEAVAFVEATRASPLAPEVVFLTWSEDADRRAQLFASGALAVLNVEVDDALLESAFDALLHRVEPVERHVETPEERAQRPTLDDFQTVSPGMRALLRLVERVSDSDASLLIRGETGTGKEWLARAIHAASTRAAEPFIAVNCAALPETLLESELFGHERGSFTGAIRTRRGRFELAHGGTLFLDEIGDMPHHMQAKLLRVLQDREVQPIGSEEVIAVDARVIAATHVDIESRSRNGQFRLDLYYRLGVLTLELPPLRERREDVPALAARYARELGRARRGTEFDLDPMAVQALCAHGWPGNVRELANVIERAVLLSHDATIDIVDLPAAVRGRAAQPGPNDLEDAPETGAAGRRANDLKSVRRRAADLAERAHLTALLETTSGRVGATADLAGVTSRALYARMRALGLRKEDFRAAAAATGTVSRRQESR